MMDFIKTLFQKNKIVIISLVLSLLLFPCIVHAAELDARTSSAALPYLVPNLDDAKIYSLASDIKAATATTYDLDDIYNMLISIRSYINTSNTTTSTILSRLEDLTGYNTAYDTHSMLVDLWSKLGGNENISLYQYVHDINECLEITDGNEAYNITELVAGIYGISGTPRSLSDIYNKLGTIDTSINDNFIAIANDTYNINSAIQRLADIYASNDVAQAKLNQQDYEDGAIADFTGSGTGAATTANKNDIKGISSTVKSGLNTGGSASNALGVFNYSNSNWSWFTTTTRNNLDRSGDNPFYTNVLVDRQYTATYSSNFVASFGTTIPADTYITMSIGTSSDAVFNSQVRWVGENGAIGDIIGNLTKANPILIYNGQIPHSINATGIRISYISQNKTLDVYIAESNPNRKMIKSNTEYIPDFITQHDSDYYNHLLEVHK